MCRSHNHVITALLLHELFNTWNLKNDKNQIRIEKAYQFMLSETILSDLFKKSNSNNNTMYPLSLQGLQAVVKIPEQKKSK